jgi:hypothetical protein
MSMDEKLEYLIHSKNWTELNREEREFVIAKLGSEEEFKSLQKVDALLNQTRSPELAPDPAVLSALQKKFQEKKVPANWYATMLSFRIPAIASALLIAIAFMIGWYSNANETLPPQPVEKLLVRVDTVYLRQRPDTIYVNRVVFRNAPASRKESPVFSVVKQEGRERQGVNMKEKEELENLLVSGSD